MLGSKGQLNIKVSKMPKAKKSKAKMKNKRQNSDEEKRGSRATLLGIMWERQAEILKQAQTNKKERQAIVKMDVKVLGGVISKGIKPTKQDNQWVRDKAIEIAIEIGNKLAKLAESSPDDNITNISDYDYRMASEDKLYSPSSPTTSTSRKTSTPGVDTTDETSDLLYGDHQYETRGHRTLVPSREEESSDSFELFNSQLSDIESQNQSVSDWEDESPFNTQQLQELKEMITKETNEKTDKTKEQKEEKVRKRLEAARKILLNSEVLAKGVKTKSDLDFAALKVLSQTKRTKELDIEEKKPMEQDKTPGEKPKTSLEKRKADSNNNMTQQVQKKTQEISQSRDNDSRLEETRKRLEQLEKELSEEKKKNQCLISKHEVELKEMWELEQGKNAAVVERLEEKIKEMEVENERAQDLIRNLRLQTDDMILLQNELKETKEELDTKTNEWKKSTDEMEYMKEEIQQLREVSKNIRVENRQSSAARQANEHEIRTTVPIHEEARQPSKRDWQDSDEELQTNEGDSRREVIKFQGSRSIFSPMYPTNIQVRGFCFLTTQQAYEFTKAKLSNKPDIQEEIYLTKSVWEAVNLGHSFDATKDWFRQRGKVILELQRHRALQDTAFRKALKASNPAKLVMNITQDAYLGVGKQGSGQNFVGRTLMQVRDELLGTERCREDWAYPKDPLYDLRSHMNDYAVQSTEAVTKGEPTTIRTEREADEQTENQRQNTEEKENKSSRERPDEQAHPHRVEETEERVHQKQEEHQKQDEDQNQAEQHTTPDIGQILQGAMGGKQLTLEDLVQALQQVSGAHRKDLAETRTNPDNELQTTPHREESNKGQQSRREESGSDEDNLERYDRFKSERNTSTEDSFEQTRTYEPKPPLQRSDRVLRKDLVYNNRKNDWEWENVQLNRASTIMSQGSGWDRHPKRLIIIGNSRVRKDALVHYIAEELGTNWGIRVHCCPGWNIQEISTQIREWAKEDCQHGNPEALVLITGINNIRNGTYSEERDTARAGEKIMADIDKEYYARIKILSGIQPTRTDVMVNTITEKVNTRWRDHLAPGWQYMSAKRFWRGHQADETLYADNVHFNDEGFRTLARDIVQTVQKTEWCFSRQPTKRRK